MSVTFPNVPPYPGVPQLARLGFAVANPLAAAVSLGGGYVLSSLFGYFSTESQWGIHDSKGNSVFVPDSILEFEHHPHWDIPDFPIQGTATTPTAFASFNKVKLPYDIRVRMSKGSTLSERQAFLKALDAAANSIALYSILTPEYTYTNADILSYDIVRTSEGHRAEGAFFLTEIDVFFREINPVQAQYSTTTLQNAQNSSAVPQSVTGTINPGFASGALANQAASASLAGSFGAI